MDKEITFEGKTWRVSASPLQDASGQEVGDLLVMFDLTAQTEAYARFLGLIGASGGVILVFLLSFVFVLLRAPIRASGPRPRNCAGARKSIVALRKRPPGNHALRSGRRHYRPERGLCRHHRGPQGENHRLQHAPAAARRSDAPGPQASLSGRPGYYEGEYLSVTGGRATRVRAFFRSVYSETGSFQGGVSIFEDYTERFQAEQNRQEYLNFLQILLNAIPNPVFYKDTNGGFFWAATKPVRRPGAGPKPTWWASRSLRCIPGNWRNSMTPKTGNYSTTQACWSMKSPRRPRRQQEKLHYP
jgi:hypothetical protein